MVNISNEEAIKLLETRFLTMSMCFEERFAIMLACFNEEERDQNNHAIMKGIKALKNEIWTNVEDDLPHFYEPVIVKYYESEAFINGPFYKVTRKYPLDFPNEGFKWIDLDGDKTTVVAWRYFVE